MDLDSGIDLSVPTVLHSQREVELWNAILSHSGRRIAVAGGRSFQFSSIERPAEAAHALLVEAEQGLRLAVVVRSFPFATMFGSDIDIPDIRTLPQPLRGCLEEGVVASFWNGLPDERLGGFRMVKSGPLAEVIRTSGEDEWQWFAVTIEGVAAEPLGALVGLSAGALLRLFRADGWGLAVATNDLAGLLTAEAFYTLGDLTLSVGALRQIRPGDVVVLSEPPNDQTLIRTNWTTYSFSRAEGGWVCAGRSAVERYRADPEMTEATIMTQGSTDTKGVLLDLDELAIVVDFDLGRFTIPLAQMQSWQPGSIVQLDPPPATDGVEVSVRANGRVIGNGDLIRIDDRMAVRLTRLTTSS